MSQLPPSHAVDSGAAVTTAPPPRQRYAGQDLTSGSIPRNLFVLAWPQVTEGMITVVDQLLDLVWAGRIGPRTIAGVGVAQSYTQMAMTGRMGIDMAMRAMISRAVGANNLALANHIVLQAFTISGVFSLIMIAVGLLFTEPLLRVLGVSHAVVDEGANYMRAMFVAQGAIAFRMMSAAALQSAGDAVTPMKATMVTRVVHVTLSPCLVFGLFFFPELGIAGAAVANAIGQLFGTSINFHSLFTGRSRLRVSMRGYRLDFPLLWRMTVLGAPASITAMEQSIAQLLLIGIIARFGDFALAAYSLTQRAQMVVNLGSQGLGNAAGIITGQCLGAGKPERVRQTVYWSLGYVTAGKVLLGAALFIFPELFLKIFNNDPELLGPAVVWLRILVVGWILMGAGMIYSQVIQIAGETFIPMVLILVTIWGVQLPLAIMLSGAAGWEVFGWTLSLPTVAHLGQYGVAWAIVIALAARVLFYIPYFQWGPWMRKRVIEDLSPAITTRS